MIDNDVHTYIRRYDVRSCRMSPTIATSLSSPFPWNILPPGNEACGFLTVFFFTWNRLGFLIALGQRERSGEERKVAHAGPAKEREQLSRVVTVRWYPVGSSAAGVRIRKKGWKDIAPGRRRGSGRRCLHSAGHVDRKGIDVSDIRATSRARARAA